MLGRKHEPKPISVTHWLDLSFSLNLIRANLNAWDLVANSPAATLVSIHASRSLGTVTVIGVYSLYLLMFKIIMIESYK